LWGVWFDHAIAGSLEGLYGGSGGGGGGGAVGWTGESRTDRSRTLIRHPINVNI